MAIELTNVSKSTNGMATITVRDTGDQVSTDEVGDPTYQTYTVRINPAAPADDAKKKIERLIAERKKDIQDESAVETSVKSTVESIDTSKIAAKE